MMTLEARNSMHTSCKTAARACVRALVPRSRATRALARAVAGDRNDGRGGEQPLISTALSSSYNTGADQTHKYSSSGSSHHDLQADNSPREAPLADAVGYVTLSTEGIPAGILRSTTLQPLAAIATVAALMNSEYATGCWMAYQAGKAALAGQVQALQNISAAAIAARDKAEADIAATKAATSSIINSLLQKVDDPARQLQENKNSLALLCETQEKLSKSEKQLSVTVAYANTLQQAAMAAHDKLQKAENRVKVLENALAAERVASEEKLTAMTHAEQVVRQLLEAKESGLSTYAIAAVAAAPRQPLAPSKELKRGPPVVPVDSVQMRSATDKKRTVVVKEFVPLYGRETEVITGPMGGKYYFNTMGNKTYLTDRKEKEVYWREVSE